MHPSMVRWLGTFALLILASRVDSSVSIPPDSTSPPLRAIDCFYDSGSLENVGDLDCPVTVCETDCDAATNRGLIGFNVSNYTAGRRFVETTVYTDFTVEAADDGAATELDGTLSYDIEWRGFWLLAGVFTGFNEVECAVTLLLWDRTNGGNRVVRQLQLHHIDAEAAGSLEGVDIGAGLDRGQTVNTLTAKVIRGHQYRVGLRLRAQGIGAFNAQISMDYLRPDAGAWWNSLTVAISPDLEARIDELEDRVTRLEEQILHHTHSYLTGRGEGHNNTTATTSEAILVDVGEPAPEEARRLPPARPGTQPLPIHSVIETGGSFATIRYHVPETSPTTVKVYDALGRVVSDLIDATETAGPHEARFETSSLPSGVYFLRVVAGRYAETRKLTLLR